MGDFVAPWPFADHMPPGLLLIAAAVPLFFLRGIARKAYQLVGASAVLWQVMALTPGATSGLSPTWMGYDLTLLYVDDLRLVFGTIFAMMGVIGTIYALHVEDWRQHVAAWTYAGGGLGVVFSGDLLTLLVYWELMAVASVVLVFSRRTPRSYAAGIRYAAVHGLGGSILLAGVVGWVASGHSSAVVALDPSSGISAWLILLGVVINAAVPPFNAWLPDAYGDGTVTGSVFLSAYTTKTAVFVLLAMFAGWEILLYAGVIMALYGVTYAMIENNIRRLLGYHIISQVGFMVAGAGMGTDLAIDGASAHAYSHILYKSLLFMSTGAVIYATGKERSTELGGLFRVMPLTMVLYAIGAASISGVPPFNGFISKSMTITAGGQGGWGWAELGLTLASVGTFLSVGLKLMFFCFISPTSRNYDEVKPLPKNMTVAMVIGAALCTLYGIAPGLLYAMLPRGSDYHPYTLHHIVESLQLLVMTGLGFWLLFEKLHAHHTISLDTDWLYRKPLRVGAMWLSRSLMAGQVAFGAWLGKITESAMSKVRSPLLAGERVVGRAILQIEDKDSDGVDDSGLGRYRLPVGFTILAMVSVFVVVVVFRLINPR